MSSKIQKAQSYPQILSKSPILQVSCLHTVQISTT